MPHYVGRHSVSNPRQKRKTVKAKTATSLTVSISAKVALVTLIACSAETGVSTDEAAVQIRRALEASSLSRSWTVEKVTVLDESIIVADGNSLSLRQ